MLLLKITFVFEAIFFCSLLSMLGRSNSTAQLIVMPMLFVLPVLWFSVLGSLSREQNKHLRQKSVIVLALAPLSLVLAVMLGPRLNDYLFYRDLPRLNEAVALIKKGAVPIEEGHARLPAEYSSLSYATHADQDSRGVWTITFFVGGGFPVKHQCYLYRSDDKITDEVALTWPRGRHREKYWFQVSD